MRIPLLGAKNTRDLGGLKTVDGKTVKQCRLIRSGRLDGLTNEDQRMLVFEHGLKTILDFRMESERQTSPDPELEDVTFFSHPILDARSMYESHVANVNQANCGAAHLAAADSGGLDPEAFFSVFYHGLITSPHAVETFRAFFDILLRQETGAILWHCTAGKDRTGIATALLLFALGVSQEEILGDYLMTNSFMESGAEDFPQSVVDSAASPRKRRGVRKAYFMTAMDAIRDAFGTVEAYLEMQMGLTRLRTQRLRDLYLD
jgi:protein-tyrosine phosphatase